MDLNIFVVLFWIFFNLILFFTIFAKVIVKVKNHAFPTFFLVLANKVPLGWLMSINFFHFFFLHTYHDRFLFEFMVK